MGFHVASGFPNQGTSSSLYGNQNLQKPEGIAGGRRSMPGGPLLPRLPRNPFGIATRRIVAHSIPQLPNRSGRTL
jgi:hypothetical protein